MISATYAIVNLAAVQHNVEKVRQYAPATKVMAVIKANAYGHGLLRIAEALDNVDAVAVARASEGLQLRKAGFKKRIAILEGFVCEQEVKQLINNDLDVVVHSEEQVKTLENYATDKQLVIWLKLDTGMNRLGFKAHELANIYQRLAACRHIHQPVSLMTHLSSADEVDSLVTKQQIDQFNTCVSAFTGEKSIVNSAGVLAYPNAMSDWVRPGLMIYGVSPFSDSVGVDWGLQPVMSLHSRLIAVKMLNPGETVGYSGLWTCQKRTRLGVVAIGYGDGYSRYAKEGTPVLVNEKRVPLIGRVSMDMITVDLTSQPDARPGDPVTLWGAGLAIEEIAKCSDTIPYTLLCGITQRVQIKKVSEVEWHG